MEKGAVQNTEKKGRRKVVTPLQKLKKKLKREFKRKKLIGDININDNEYEILIDYFIDKSDRIINGSYNTIQPDIMFSVALVQIGIKLYDGNYWAHVAGILNFEKIKAKYQTIIGDIFIKTLVVYHKDIIDNGERVKTILMHGFVSDYFAGEMFDFLFKYYNIDLERDIQRNSRDMMNSLTETILRKDNTGRTYLLVKQTADAIRTNTRGGKIRLRRFMRLIDKYFWEQISPEHPTNRLSILFNEWKESSEEFKLQYNNYHMGVDSHGKRSFSSPYICCDIASNRFSLVLPKQLVKFEFENGVYWRVGYEDKSIEIKTATYPAVTGYKTEEQKLLLKEEDIFSEIFIELMWGQQRIRMFKIRKDCIRFFDNDGNAVNSNNNIPKGRVHAFIKTGEKLYSEAVIDEENLGYLTRVSFDFEFGDIIRLPDGKILSIGKRTNEGLLERKLIRGTWAIFNDHFLPVYSAPPSILFKTNGNRAAGIAIDINNTRYRMLDHPFVEIELNDRSSDKGYILALKEYGCIDDGVYSVKIDIPNYKGNMDYYFVLINSMEYSFEDAPYIFTTKGTIRFNDSLSVALDSNKLTKNMDENSYNFNINPTDDNLLLSCKVGDSLMELSFNIPALKWSFDDEIWNVEKPSDIWHSDFPTKVFLKCPENNVTLSMDEDIESCMDQKQSYVKSKERDIIECDLTRFKSWLGKDKSIRSIYIDNNGKYIEFLRVMTQSIVISHMIKGDFKEEKLIGMFNIIGKSNYYADIIKMDDKSVIADKYQIINGRLTLNVEPQSGRYQVRVYEEDNDDTGFGISYMLINEFLYELVDPYDMTGRSMEIKQVFYHNVGGIRRFNYRYIITDLERLGSDNHKYKGMLVKRTWKGDILIDNNIRVVISNLDEPDNISLSYFDGYDYVEFLYDSRLSSLEKTEVKGLKSSERYRRYECLFEDEFKYKVDFINEIGKLIALSESEVASSSETGTIFKKINSGQISISDMKLSIGTYNCLKRAHICWSEEIFNMGIKRLFKIRNLGKMGVIEIVERMHELGYEMDEDYKLNTSNNM